MAASTFLDYYKYLVIIANILIAPSYSILYVESIRKFNDMASLYMHVKSTMLYA